MISREKSPKKRPQAGESLKHSHLTPPPPPHSLEQASLEMLCLDCDLGGGRVATRW